MRNILKSISGKYILLSIALIVFWIIAGFLAIDRINSARHLSTIQEHINENITRSAIIHGNSLSLISLATLGGSPETITEYGESEQLRLEIITGINSLEEDPYSGNLTSFSRRSRMIRESCNELNRIENEYISLLIHKGDPGSGLILKITSLLDESILQEKSLPPDFYYGLKNEFQDYLIKNNPEILSEIIISLDMKMTGADLHTGSSGDFSATTGSLPLILNRSFKDLLRTDRKLGFHKSTVLTNELKLFNEQLKNQLNTMNDEFRTYSNEFMNSSLNRFIIFLVLTGLLTGGLIIYFSSGVLRSFDRLSPALKELSLGRIPEEISVPEDSETGQLAEYTNRIAVNLGKKLEFVNNLENLSGNEQDLLLSEKDELGNALLKVHDKMIITEENNRKRIEEDHKRNWHNEGLAQFSEIFRYEFEDINELSFRIIKKLVSYLEASHGSLFILNTEDPEDPVFDLSATFAYDRRKFLQKRIRPGEGLCGTCALEKESIFLTDIPDDYIEITSGLGGSSPRSLLIVPLIVENISFGIMEIASLKVLRDFEIEFVKRLSENISTSIASVKNNINTRELLQKIHIQTEEKEQQDEKMRKKVKELEKALEESKNHESGIKTVLNAIHNSLPVATYSLNGRIADINDKFTALLELSPDQILGKHHSEFSTTNRQSEEYRQFWNDLKKGETKSITEKFRLFSGKEIWLKQTFTPIPDEQKKTKKILSIANDITEIRNHQEALGKQSAEISRKNREMLSLSEAVDQSIIKCELSPEGTILHVNMNYCQVTGLSLKELSGKNIRLFLKKEEAENFDNILTGVLKDRSYSGVVRRTKPTGEEVWLMSNFAPVKDEYGKIYKIYFLAQDITEKRLKYQLLEEANKEIERLRKKI